MPSPVVNEMTRQEWRKLGFFYDFDDTPGEWRLRGSRAGLANFVRIVRYYAACSLSGQVSEHIHLGPYSYLKIGTAERAEITSKWIAGPLGSLSELASGDRTRPYGVAGRNDGEVQGGVCASRALRTLHDRGRSGIRSCIGGSDVLVARAPTARCASIGTYSLVVRELAGTRRMRGTPARLTPKPAT